ncbi:MAG: sigma-70 family RNA polymerase sigma factor [Pirellulaceae bacterium]|nr:sigma-70 family RNA polymerase sigma factor [Pirellulaceae bacterium]
MSQTSASLLGRVQADPQSPAWVRLVELYEPLVRGWLRRHEVLAHDADDLVQEVLAVVVRRLPEFQHNQRVGAFRAWLRTITVNVLRDHWRGGKRRPAATGTSDFQELLAQLEDPASGMSQLWDQEHDRHVTRRLLEMLKGEFEPRTWQAFSMVALEGNSPAEVAARLGLSVNAVFIAKSRVLARLRQEAEGLID